MNDLNREATWGLLARLFCNRFERNLTDKVTVGPLVFPSGKKVSVTVHGHKKGLFVSRRPFPYFRGRVWIGWDLVQSVNVYPSQVPAWLSDRTPAWLGDHTDAKLTIKCDRVRNVEIPWEQRFSELLPESVHIIDRSASTD